MSTRVVTVVILALTFLFLPSEAQQTAKIPRLGFLAPQGRSLPLFDAFRQGLADLAYIDGHNITLTDHPSPYHFSAAEIRGA